MEKIKGKSWAGNIFHQFESICQDVDDFMSKDTVKFVENQVQSVGVSVKRFYSNVMQDILPLSEDILKCKAQMVDGKQVVTQDHVNSIMDIRIEPTCVNEMQLSESQRSTDTPKNSDASLPIELNHVMHVTTTPDSDPSQENKSYLHLSEDGDGILSNDNDNSLEEKDTRDLVPLTASSSFRNDISSEMSDKDHKRFTMTMDPAPAFSSCEVGMSDDCHKNSALNIDNSPALSDPEAVHLSITKDTISCSSFSEEMVWPSDISTSGCTIKSNLAMVDHPYSDENSSLAASVTSSEKVNKHAYAEMDSPLPSTSDAVAVALANFDKTRNLASVSTTSGDQVDEYERVIMKSPLPSPSNTDVRALVNSDDNRYLSASSAMSANKVEYESMIMDSPFPYTSNAADTLGTDGTPCYSFSTRDENSDVSSSLQSPEHAFSYFPGEKQKKTVMPYTCFTSPKSSDIIESRPANFIKNSEIVCHPHAEFDGCAYNIPTSEAVSYESKSVDVLRALLIPEPNGSSARTYDLAESTPFQTDKSDFVIGSSENRLEQHPKNHESKFSISLEDAYEYGVGARDQNMETIDLSPDVKDDKESVIFNGVFVHSSSFRRRDFRYYKKLIQDAFTSRKRLSKEYKHLAILYGDTDKESSQHFHSNSAPASPNKYAHTAGTQLSQEMCESEWELL